MPPAPPIQGQDFINNEPFTTDTLDKILLLSLVERNWPGCDSLIGCLEELWNKYGGRDNGIEIVALVKDEASKLWLESEDVTFRGIYNDVIWGQYKALDAATEDEIPYSYIIDRDMNIRNSYFGSSHPMCPEQPWIDIEHLIEDYIYEHVPIDLEMVMDVSGSMNRLSPNDLTGDTKLEMMKDATEIIGNFLNTNGHINDKMGLIWFTDTVSEYNLNGQKLLIIRDNTNWEALGTRIRDLTTGGCTAMGAGLQTAFNILNSDVSTQKKFAILCTDGMQNINPVVKKVPEGYYVIKDVDGEGGCGDPLDDVERDPEKNITEYNTCVHTIGIGITANYDVLLQEIADQTGGFYKGTNDPYRELLLIYITDLCNCMAGGSPSILYHNIGSLSEDEHEKAEIFYLNNSVRKITAILSWKKSQESNFMFWLYSPDGALLNLHHEMKLYKNHCMATIYLPKRQNGEHLEYIGEWRMIIRGELPTTPADYHVFIIGEDTDVKLLVDFPRKTYEVGDILPIKVAVLKGKKPIEDKPKEMILEIKSLPVPLPELLAEYKVSVNDLIQKMKPSTKIVPKNPLILKLNAMTTDPQFQKRLMPFTQRFSLQKGDFELKIENKKTFIPIELEQPGLHSFKITVRYEDPENGPICRTDMVSIIVGPGKADPEHTKINFIEPSTDKLKGKIINVTPRNKEGQLLGPGYSNKFKLQAGKKEFDVEFEDLLDGTYQIELPVSEKEVVEIEEKELDVDITFHNNLIWTGKL